MDSNLNNVHNLPKRCLSHNGFLICDLSELMMKCNFVSLPCQDPVFPNGRITRFDIEIQDQKDKIKNGSMERKSIPVNRSEEDSSSSQRMITNLEQIHLAGSNSVKVRVTAINSVGKSPEALLGIREKAHGTYSWRL